MCHIVARAADGRAQLLRRSMRAVAVAAVLFFALSPGGRSFGAPQSAQPAQPDARALHTDSAARDNPADTTAAPAEPVPGFRSAHFGMSEADVRKAIRKDFGAAADAIKSDTNRAERTQVLTINVPDLLPGGGHATVAYVFGYKTKDLIQVGVTWSKASDPAITPEMLFANADVLREYFLQAGYVPATVTTNQPIQNGVLMFRGSDRDGHETVLLLVGTVEKAADSKRVLSPTALNLIYVADPKAPDIYRLPKGDF